MQISRQHYSCSVDSLAHTLDLGHLKKAKHFLSELETDSLIRSFSTEVDNLGN
jgi:hypothetical protein